MSLVKRSNGGFWSDFPSLFDDFWTRDWFDWALGNFSATGTTVPAVNIIETRDSFEVEMAAPGMDKKDFKVELDGNLLTISSEKKDERELKEGENYTRREFSYQSFRRTFTLPKDVVDVDQIKAHYKDGILHLTIPKKEEAKQKPPKMIEIA
ncbi:MAG: Hsp20/alpha crystallin family protein [Thermoflavifilum aggregans]|nr:Hsp20/alpha crystallin family protein [Thermoflavifilum aggregans]